MDRSQFIKSSLLCGYLYDGLVLMNLVKKIALCLYISSVYSPFSDRVGLPLHNIPYSGVLMKSIGADFF